MLLCCSSSAAFSDLSNKSLQWVVRCNRCVRRDFFASANFAALVSYRTLARPQEHGSSPRTKREVSQTVVSFADLVDKHARLFSAYLGWARRSLWQLRIGDMRSMTRRALHSSGIKLAIPEVSQHRQKSGESRDSFVESGSYSFLRSQAMLVLLTSSSSSRGKLVQLAFVRY